MPHESFTKTGVFSELYIKELKSVINLIISSGYSSHVSYPFIPDLELNKKIAVVGLETKAWVDKLSSIQDVVLNEDEIIKKSFEKYNEYKLFKDKNKGFGWLVNAIHDISGESPAWLNFFAFSYKNGSVNRISNKNKLNDKIKDYSVLKLTEEIKVLEPRVIIFAGNYFKKFDCLAGNLTKNRTIIKDGFYRVEKWDSMIIARVPHPARRIKERTKITRENIRLAVDLYMENESLF
ncbi:hypothetical protein [Providencia stuartii]|uniref:hypothetical protein n=1 Tax=Providencia stuartii TaxID=588 RepID=UPI0034E504DE